MDTKPNSTADLVFKISGFLFLVGAAYVLLHVVSGGLLKGILGDVGGNAFLTMIAFWVMIAAYLLKARKNSEDSNSTE